MRCSSPSIARMQLAHELPDVLGVDRRRERLGVAQHGLGVLVPGDLVGAAEVVEVAASLDHRALGPPGPGPLVVGLGLEEVDQAVGHGSNVLTFKAGRIHADRNCVGKDKGEKLPKQLGPATILKPVIIGGLVLVVINAVLGFVLGG